MTKGLGTLIWEPWKGSLRPSAPHLPPPHARFARPRHALPRWCAAGKAGGLPTRLGAIGLLVGAMIAGAAASGCGTNKPGGLSGTGGSAGGSTGTGGSTGSGGISAGGGIAGTGTGGIASGGIGSGGIASGGIGGKFSGGTGGGGIASGGIASGGISLGGVGSGGIAVGGIASGGIVFGGISSGGVASGGIGSGGIASGGTRGTGGTGSGGCPAGQTWCEGCTPGTGSCAATCPSLVCPGPDAGCTGSGCSRDARANDEPLGSCSQVTTQTECDSRNDCHSVFVDPGTCGCAGAGCCAHFSRCADGANANCSGPALCKMAQPFCEAPYVLSYTGNCYEGCVLQSKCAPATCPQTPPANASGCGSGSVTCFYEDCASTGRTLAVCAGGTWTVQTAACGPGGPMSCSANGTTSTCTAGEMCVITTSVGGAYLVRADCRPTCGPGLVTPQCIDNAGNNCFATYSLTSGVTVNCSNYFSCGSGQGGCV